jgi:hypothetical protein
MREAIVDTKSFVIEVRFLRVEMPGGEPDKYDWYATNGRESTRLFDSLEEAQENAEEAFG